VEPVDPELPDDPDEPVVPEEPLIPESPVLAKVISRSVLFVIELIELLTNAQSTSKKPEFCVRDAIENNKKSPGTPLFDILKCPLIVLVESSIVARKSVIVEPS
tara:strand:- start:424 stop:735 length:312 start_codon:yes stop_codon:yes gene_type:complete